MNNIVSLETFRNIVKHIQKQEETDRQLTNILVSEYSNGFISTGDDLISDMFDLLQDIFEDEYETLEWWWYDINDNDKFIWEDIKGTDTQIQYDLNDIDSLYYYMCKQYDQVPQKVVQKEENETQIISTEDTMDMIKSVWGMQDDEK